MHPDFSAIPYSARICGLRCHVTKLYDALECCVLYAWDAADERVMVIETLHGG